MRPAGAAQLRLAGCGWMGGGGGRVLRGGVPGYKKADLEGIPNLRVVECSDQLSNFLRGFSQIVEFIKANSFVAQRLKNWHE